MSKNLRHGITAPKKENMLYDKYKQRMLKIKTAIKTAIRNRMIILCCLLACLACASGLVLLKGTVYSLAKSPGEVVYGSSVNFSAKAFMGEVYYEYYYNGKCYTRNKR